MVEGGQETADDPGQFDAPGLRLDAFLFTGVELLIQSGEASGKGTHGVFVARPHHYTHGQILERYGGLGDERLAGGLE